MNGQKGISTLLMIIIIVGLIVVVGAGLFIYQYIAMQQTGPTACTEEAKVCPDGSTVSRTGSNCEFALCPTGISADSLNNATLSYPNPYDVSKTDTFVLVNGKTDVIYDTGNMKPRVYTATTTAIGDLDGDGVADGAIGIYQGYGANIIVPIVFVFSSKNGALTQIDSVLPDTSNWNYETQIKSFSIDNNILSVNLLILAEKDQSLPHYQQQASVEKTVQYKLIDEKLVVQSDLTAGWKTYNFTATSGLPKTFSFKYPADWKVDLGYYSGVAMSVNITSPDEIDVISYSKGSPAGEISCISFENQVNNNEIHGKGKCTTIEGIPYFIVYQNDNSLTIYNQIVSTFKFTK